jgi:rSAM/selenodomain-associated transferase 1
MKKKHLLWFVKFPEPGKVKTRLGNTIGQGKACELYIKCIQDIMQVLKNLENTFHIHICGTPGSQKKYLLSITDPSYNWIEQKGASLTERLIHCCLECNAEDDDQLIIFGSDIPEISTSLFEKTTTLLDTYDYILGPSHDGGYYLIAFTFKNFITSAFKNITWSTNTVLKETITNISNENMSYTLLETLTDIDTKNDLHYFYSHCNNKRLKSYLFAEKILFIREAE